MYHWSFDKVVSISYGILLWKSHIFESEECIADSSALSAPALRTSELLATLGTFHFHVCLSLANDHHHQSQESSSWVPCVLRKYHGEDIDISSPPPHSGAGSPLPIIKVSLFPSILPSLPPPSFSGLWPLLNKGPCGRTDCFVRLTWNLKAVHSSGLKLLFNN